MTITSALNAGVAGLNANAARLATISDNIANSGTFGYKRVVAEFESMVIAQSRGAGQYSAGGVRAQTSRLIDERGALVGTSNPLDIAVSGRGMLPVMQSVDLNGTEVREMLLTRTGSFRPDANGVLRSDSGFVLLGVPADSNGRVATFPRDSIAALEPVVVPSSQKAGDPTTEMSLGINLPATQTAAGSPAVSLPLSVEYFGNLGASERLEFSFTPTIPTTGSSNTWTMEIRDSAQGGAVIGDYTIVFDDSRGSGGTLLSVTPNSGGPYDPATGTIALTVAGGPLSLAIGRPNDADGITQLSDEFLPTGVTKNGSPVGNLTGVEIDESGFLNATYDTGFVRTLYQVPLVDVQNPNGLMSLNNQAFKVSQQSGSFFLWDAGSGPTGPVVGFARENSTTDVAAELTNLIKTQRAYSSNAKVITTVDEMLQETTNIKR
jgi:flagellar hook protein FlgE